MCYWKRKTSKIITTILHIIYTTHSLLKVPLFLLSWKSRFTTKIFFQHENKVQGTTESNSPQATEWLYMHTCICIINWEVTLFTNNKNEKKACKQTNRTYLLKLLGLLLRFMLFAVHWQYIPSGENSITHFPPITCMHFSRVVWNK